MIYNEDCLSINVVRPAGISPSKKLPVGVWIHGGGFFIGGSCWPYNNLSHLVNASQQAGKPIIAVSFNYRLGILGFLAGSELAAEGNVNLGLHDQRLALRWINENIASFGGDPEKVTIFGESAYAPN
jgi:triacylglycerol lipase